MHSPSPDLHSMNFNQMVSEVIQLYIANRKEVEIRLSLDECMSEMQADPVRIRQLIHNLVKNASEAVDDRGWISLKTVCVEEHGCYYIEFSVEDSGSGIKDEVMDTLFEPYVTAKKTGSGLGLAIVKKIVDEHSGLVWAENSEAGGARFVVRLPMMRDV